jgi:hypothetical protein
MYAGRDRAGRGGAEEKARRKMSWRKGEGEKDFLMNENMIGWR